MTIIRSGPSVNDEADCQKKKESGRKHGEPGSGIRVSEFTTEVLFTLWHSVPCPPGSVTPGKRIMGKKMENICDRRDSNPGHQLGRLMC
eukprot:94099-Hanusia_phi.AAC.1